MYCNSDECYIFSSNRLPISGNFGKDDYSNCAATDRLPVRYDSWLPKTATLPKRFNCYILILSKSITRYWPNSLDCTDLNQCGVRRDAELCRLCYKQITLSLPYTQCHGHFALKTVRFSIIFILEIEIFDRLDRRWSVLLKLEPILSYYAII